VLASTLIYGELGTNWSSSIQKRNPLEQKPAQPTHNKANMQHVPHGLWIFAA